MWPLLTLPPLTFGRFRQRLSRVSALVDVDGRIEKAHLTNTGRLLDILYSGAQVILIPIQGLKTRWRIVGAPLNSKWASVIDTHTQEKAVWFALLNHLIPSFHEWNVVKRHPKVKEGLRFDFLLRQDHFYLWLEVKSAVYFFPEDKSARYPDTISLRGRKHLEYALSHPKEVALLFVVGDPRAAFFKPSEDDPVLAQLIRKIWQKNMKMHAIQIACAIDKSQIILWKTNLPIVVG